MATMAIGYRHNPKPRGTTAPTPFTNWAKGRIRSSDGGFQAQTQKYVYSKYNTAETRVYCGKKATTYSLNNNGTSGQIYTPDVKYGSTDDSHNTIWMVEWDKYSMGVSGVSFDFVQKQGSTGWGFGKMWLFYKHATSGSYTHKEITPISGCKTGNNDNFTFHRSNTQTYAQITNFQDQSYGTRAHLIAAGDYPGDNWMCVGWGGFFSATKQANVTRDHGFVYQNFYLLPSGSISTSDRWIGGMANNSNAPSGRYILTQ